MSDIKLDLSKFKYVSSDDNTTTLEHSKGHKITLAHKALPKKYQEQFKALQQSKPKEEPQKLNQGGNVEPQMSMPPELMQQPQPVLPDQFQAPELPQQEVITEDPMLATIQQAKQIESQPMPKEKTRYEELKMMFPMQSDEAILRTIEIEGKQKAIQDTENQKLQAEVQAQEANNQQQIQELALRKQQAGIPLNELEQKALQPQSQDIPPQPQGLAENVRNPAETQPQTQLNQQPQAPTPLSGVDQQVQGVFGEAKILGDISNKQVAIQENAIKLRQKALEDYEKTYNDSLTETNNLISDIKNNQISPDKFWENKSKTMAIIGIMLSGFHATNRPNAAVEMLNKQMDRDLQAQQANMDKKKNLLSLNFQKLGDMRAAKQLTLAQMEAVAADEMEMVALKSNNQLLMQRAQQEAGQLRASAQEKMKDTAKNRSIADLVRIARQDPNQTDQAIELIAEFDPKTADNLREKQIPGFGIASTNEGAKTVRELKATTETVNSAISRLNEIVNTTGKSLSIPLREEAETIRRSLIGRLRVPLTGPGAMNESEQRLLESLIPDVTGMTSLDMKSRAKLKALSNQMNTYFERSLVANGIKNPMVSNNTNTVKGKDGRMYRQQIINGKSYMVPINE